jgi:hypothetical protein
MEHQKVKVINSFVHAESGAYKMKPVAILPAQAA